MIIVPIFFCFSVYSFTDIIINYNDYLFQIIVFSWICPAYQ